MKLIGIYKEHTSITAVYCPACFVLLKLNDRFLGFKTVETNAVNGLSNCRYCGDNQGPKQYHFEALAQEKKWKK